MADKNPTEMKLEKARREERERRQLRDENLQKPFHFADRLNAAIKRKVRRFV